MYFSRLSGIKNFGFAKDFLLSLMIPTLISFALIGLWHGAGWNFILFGAYWGLVTCIYINFKPHLNKFKIPKLLSSICVFNISIVVRWTCRNTSDIKFFSSTKFC